MASSSSDRWSKENAAPRNERPVEETERRVQRFESLVSTGTGKDPLEHWLAYMKWSQENANADGNTDTQAHFLLMERCTRTLLTIPQYKNDPRFIRVCVLYADKTSNPADVFKLLHQHDVGSEVSLFYMSWAWVAELKGDYAFCEKIYKKGLAKEATPLKLLQQRHKQFQRRMSRHWLNNSSLQQDDGAPVRGQSTKRRGDQSSSRSSRQKSSTAFAVQVDDECQASQRQESEQPKTRGGRAFQERQDTVHEHITKKLKHTDHGKAKAGPSANCGFSKELVAKDINGQECCFEEYRARGQHYKIVRKNFNCLSVEESIEDVDMEEDESTVVSKESGRRVLFAMNVSVDHDQRSFVLNASTASSTVSRFVGMAASREEETINTKFAMKELSMMFSSPAHGVDDSRNELLKRPKFNESFDGPLMEEDDNEHVNNSIVDYEEQSEAKGFQIFQHDDSKKAFQIFAEEEPALSVEKKGFQIFSEDNAVRPMEKKAFAIFSGENEAAESRPLEKKGFQVFHDENEEASRYVDKKGFQIFSDENEAAGTKQSHSIAKKRFQIFNSENEEVAKASRHIENKGFEIFSDENEAVGTKQSDSIAKKGFQIFNSENEEVAKASRRIEEKGFQIFSDENQAAGTKQSDSIVKKGFQIFNSENEEVAKASRRIEEKGFQIFNDVSIRQDSDDDSAGDEIDGGGDTASLSLFGDAMDALNDMSQTHETRRSSSSPVDSRSVPNVAERKPFRIFTDDKSSPFSIRHKDDGEEDEDSVAGEAEGGDTATLSVFGEAMDALNDMSQTKADPRPSSLSPPQTDDFRKYRPRDSGLILMDGAAFGDISVIDADASRIQLSPTLSGTEFGNTEKVDYKSLHKDDVRLSIRQLNNEACPMDGSTPFAYPETDLVITLSKKGNIVDLPNQSLPRGLKRKTSTQGEEIKVGSRTGIVKQELGRGSYGVVVLLDSTEEGVTAVKAQSPTDCLAWEYVLMKRLEERCTSDPFPFPKPLSFVSLADGALLGMTAGSKNGMNLVDVSNVYKVQTGGPVPELIALHYTARMLKHIETLHWRGKILHCDVKPDNWVMVASDSAYDDCCELVEAADLMLVDFGRAVDLISAARDGVDPMDVKLSGQATDPDMACAAMRMNLGWSFDIDTFGICASAHVLLYGTHIEMDTNRSKRWKTRKPLRRYWQKELWSEFFDTLLNDAIASRPGSLRQLRDKIEDYLKTKKKELAYLLKHQARILPKKRLE